MSMLINPYVFGGPGFNPSTHIGSSGSPAYTYVKTYDWLTGTGFGTASTQRNAGIDFVRDFTFGKTDNYFGVSGSETPYAAAFPHTTASRLGAKFANPSPALAGTSYDVDFNVTDTAVAFAHSSSPCVTVYAFSGSGFGTKFANPGTAVDSTAAYGVNFGIDGSYIAASKQNSPYVAVYNWSGSGFGSKFSNPATYPSSRGNKVDFSRDMTMIAVAHETFPRVTAYPWSAAGFGTKLANPATPPTGDGMGVSFSPDGLSLAVAHVTAPSISVYPISVGGFGTKYGNPSPAISGNSQNSPAFSGQSLDIAIKHDNSPRLTVHAWNPGFGTKYANMPTISTYQGAASFKTKI